MSTVYTTCRYCEANCALEVEVVDGRVQRIRADKASPQSWRDACSKGLTARELVEHPQRITAPMKRVGDHFVEVSYEQALEEIAGQLGGIVARHGADALGYYYGNPAGFTSAIALSMGFMQGLGSSNLYSASSIDQNNNHVVSEAVFGHVFVPFSADVDRADYMLLIGMNPAESKFNWLGNTSDGWARVRRAMLRGATAVVVDPRKTLTARQASEHLSIVPGEDWALLLALLKVIVERGAYRQPIIEQLPTEQWRQLTDLLSAASAALLSERCGIGLVTIERVALDFAAAERGMCLTQTGVSMHETGTIAHWLGVVLDIITGHLDQPGGRCWDAGYVNMTEFARRNMPPESRSRVRGQPTVMGYRALAELPDEINTPGPGQCRAMIVHCGNPVISGPNGAELDRSLASLDLLVAVDLVQRESHRHADWLIPGVHWLERGELVYNLAGGMDQPHVQYSQQALEPPQGVVPEWQFFTDLALAMGVPMLGRRGINTGIRLSRWVSRLFQRPDWAFSPRTLEWLMVVMGKTVSWRALRDAPHGMTYGDKHYGQLADQMGDIPIQIAPRQFVAELESLLGKPLPSDDSFPLRLIGKRTLNMMNSWQMELPNTGKRNERLCCEIHPGDALAMGIAEGDMVVVESGVGRIELPATLCELLTSGVICIQHGWGSRVFDPRRGGEAVWQEGVNRNLLVDHRRIDPFSGTPSFNSTAVRVVKRGGNSQDSF